MKKILLFVIALFALTPLHPSSAQEEGTRFTTDSGIELHIPEGMDYVIDNPIGPNTIFNIYPPQGENGGMAKANLLDQTKQTQLSAKKIVFKLESEEYLLDVQAKIVQQKDILIGPVKIEYLPQKNTMIAVGTDQAQASFTYYRENQPKPIELKAKELHFLFKDVNGSKQLIQVRAVKNYSSRFNVSPGSSSTPDLSGN